MSEPRRTSSDPGVARATRIARILDDAYVDPIIGLLLPGVGDVVASALGFYIVGVAIDRKLPKPVIARMLINLALDSAIGAIPIAGDLFDAAYKANRRNLALLTARHEARRARASDWLFVAAAVCAVAIAVFIPIYILVRVIAWIA